MDMLDLYIRVVKALDEIGAPYMIVGAFGGTIYGITRATQTLTLLWIYARQIMKPYRKGFPSRVIMLTLK